MAAFKNKDNGTWYVQFRYTDWKGEHQQKLKRGFATKREALEWEREFLMEKQADVNMTFESFVALYEKDIKPKLKLNTWLTKESIIKKKILPYFANRKLSEITAKDIIRWQNEIRELRDCHGKPLSKTYLKTVHNQLSAIFNHAARFYGLNINPARQAGNMGTEERKEMLFWTREEYTRFSEAMMDKPLSFYAFEVLYWCGVREGELLALTPADFDFEKRTVSINKSYQRLKKQDVITTPKTPKSNRVIQMPQFLCDELQDYLKQLYGVEPDSRMFPISKSYENTRKLIVLCNKRPLLWPTSEDIKRGPGEVPSHRSGLCQILDIGSASGHTPPGKSHRPPTWRRPVARNRASHAAGRHPCSSAHQLSGRLLHPSR